MTVDTTPVTVYIQGSTARALWAAMHHDDDLASDYADLAIIHALNHLLADMVPKVWTDEQRALIYENLGQARADATRRERSVADRFADYVNDQPPF